MEEILIIWLAVAACALPWVLLIMVGRKRARRVAVEMEISGTTETYDERVKVILSNALRGLERQHAAGYGPWISGLLDGGLFMGIVDYDRDGKPKVEREWTGASPSVALTAIQWTIRDILSAPISYDKEGREIPRRKFNLDGLYKAETELNEIMGEWG